MSLPLEPPFPAAHDGTSQPQRLAAALAPAYVSVDERSARDLLAFARKYGEALRYVDDQLRPAGTWAGFLDGDLDELEAYLQDPERFGDEGRARYGRPHRALFLAFLELFGHAQAQMNDLTRRHLDFYYREALRLSPRPAVPDRVHVLVEPAPGQRQVLLPAGTLLAAGRDGRGAELHYRTDHDLVAGQARVAHLKSLYVEKQVYGLADVRRDPDLVGRLGLVVPAAFGTSDTPAARRLAAMLVLALGDPDRRYALDPYPGPQELTPALLERLDALVHFIQSALYLRPATFHTVMEVKEDVDRAAAGWARVNAILERGGQRKRGDPAYRLQPAASADFEANLDAALGPLRYDGLPEVNDVYGLYRQRARDDVKAFVAGPDARLHLTLDEFAEMMGIVDGMYRQWRHLADLLRAAGLRRQKAEPGHAVTLPNLRAYDPDRFGTLVAATLGAVDYAAAGVPARSLDDVYAALRQLEAYFVLPAESYAFIRAVQAKDGAQPWEWQEVYDLLAQAHAGRELARRRARLQAVREAQGFDAMVRFALGDPHPGDPLPGRRTFTTLDPDRDAEYVQDELFLSPNSFRLLQRASAGGVSAEEWEAVYLTLEQAQRRKRGWGPPQIGVERWQNVYAASRAGDAVAAGRGDAPAYPRWHTFGGAAGTPGTEPATLGFAVASPVLSLSEGTRTVTLILDFDAATFDAEALAALLAPEAAPPLRFVVSTAAGPYEVPGVRVAAGSFRVPGASGPYAHALQCVFTLDSQAPPVVPPAAPGGPAAPVLQVLLRDVAEDGAVVKRYPVFGRLALQRVHVGVEVEGITQLALQTDDRVLDPRRPFEPFGLQPVEGASLYVAHPELCAKALDVLWLDLEWMGAPASLRDHYLGYRGYEKAVLPLESPFERDTDVKARIKLFDDRAFFEVGQVPLFDAADAQAGAFRTHRVEVGRAAIQAAYPGYARPHGLVAGAEVLDWSRYWQVELAAPGLLHAVYPLAVTAYAQQRAKTPDAPPVVVRPPYTPRVKRVTAGYTASVEVDPAGGGADRLYHVEPFGYRPLAPGAEGGYPFVPVVEHDGALYVGIEALAPPETLSLLFQMAEGSADPDAPRSPVRWSYLDGDRWRTLDEGRLLADTTNGLLNSGLLTFDLPVAAPGTLLPPGAYWLRAAVAHGPRSVSDAVAVYAQAVAATSAGEGPADRLGQPLPPEQITALVEPRADVRAVRQPFSSSGGAGPEQDAGFYLRVSERLRHKSRALTGWDYERMVLEAFPGVYKVRCLPAGSAAGPEPSGEVVVVVIPDLRGQLPAEPFEPKVPADVLVRIEQYLRRHTSAWARFTVRNPRYVPLRVRLAVRLKPGCSPGYYLPLLNDELVRFLAPWAYEPGTDIVFGGHVQASPIVRFVASRPYVDYLAGVKLFTSPDGVTFAEVPRDGAAAAGAPDAILVPVRQHVLDLIPDGAYDDDAYAGVNYMKIELDFKVAPG